MAIRRIVYLLCIISLVACNESKYLADGQNLYADNKVKTQVTDVKKKKAKAVASELEGLTRPRLNSKILGIRFRLWVYNIAGTPKKNKGIKHWLKYKVGEPPVLASPTLLEKNRDVMQNHLENKGFFKDTVVLSSTVKDKKLTAIYTAQFGPQYTIRNVSFPNDSDDVSKRIDSVKRRTLLIKGDPYDLDVIKEERVRIDSRLKQRGFYFFNPTFLVVDLDTTVGKHQVDMYMKIKEDAPDEGLEIWRINNIKVFAEYDLHSDTTHRGITTPDGIRIVDTANLFKPTLFSNTISYRPGSIYRLSTHTQTLSRMVSLGVFKFVKARYEKADSNNNKLNVTYYLNPTQKKSIRFEVSGLSRSDNTTGGEVALSWRNRNLFKGAELFTASIYAGLEEQFLGGTYGKVGTRRGGIDLNLYFPRIISGPFHWSTSSAFVPKTRINVGYDIFDRTHQYSLTSARANFGYIFKQSLQTEHTVTLFSINYVRPTNIDPAYQLLLDSNIAQARAIEKQFIIGSSYNFNYNSQAKPNHNLNNFYFNGNVDLSGNILGLITGANLDRGKEVHILNTPFSQYARFEGDIRHYLTLGKYSVLASRITGGIGIAYGNSLTMPFVKQFFAGGTNDIRAFRSRALGPGSFNIGNINKNSFIPDQPGDVKLEMNMEYRAKLFSIVRWALFVDAGNIWTRTYDSARVGSAFSSHFLNDVGVGIGTGLRFDLSILVLRIDVATPVRYPWYPDGHKWVFNKTTDISNMILNLAIGYPF